MGSFEANVRMILMKYYKIDGKVTRLKDKSFNCVYRLDTKCYTVNHIPRGLNSTIMAYDFIKLFSVAVPNFRYKVRDSYHITSKFKGSKTDKCFVNDVYYTPCNDSYEALVQIYGDGGSFYIDTDRQGTNIRERVYNHIKYEIPHILL